MEVAEVEVEEDSWVHNLENLEVQAEYSFFFLRS